MAKSTYYFELTKVDLVDKRNTELKDEIQKILQNIKVVWCTPCIPRTS